MIIQIKHIRYEDLTLNKPHIRYTTVIVTYWEITYNSMFMLNDKYAINAYFRKCCK